METNDIIGLTLTVIGVAYVIWYFFLGGIDGHIRNYLLRYGIDLDYAPTEEEVCAWERETDYGADGQDFVTWCTIRRTVTYHEHRYGGRPDPLPTGDDILAFERDTAGDADAPDFAEWWCARQYGALAAADTV